MAYNLSWANGEIKIIGAIAISCIRCPTLESITRDQDRTLEYTSSYHTPHTTSAFIHKHTPAYTRTHAHTHTRTLGVYVLSTQQGTVEQQSPVLCALRT